ncbi:MAG: DUF6492 family protein [Cyanobacteria bacterium J06638_22]
MNVLENAIEQESNTVVDDLTFAFVTPSYAPDFQRCKLLCWSIKQFISVPVKHYLIVERKDLALFNQLADANTVILTKEDILPSWIKRIPFYDKKNFWLNLKGYKSGNWLIRGWLIQQIVKLAAAEYVKEDVLVFVDSDVAFIDKFDVSQLINEGNKVRLFRVEHSTDMDIEVGKKWKVTAKKLLGIPADIDCYDFYVHQIVTWRRDHLLQMYRLLEKNHNDRNWVDVLCGVNDLSEYTLYGIFVNYVLGEASGHYDDHRQKICWCYWREDALSTQELTTFFQEAQTSGHKAVMLSAKSSIDLSIEQFQSYLAAV